MEKRQSEINNLSEIFRLKQEKAPEFIAKQVVNYCLKIIDKGFAQSDESKECFYEIEDLDDRSILIISIEYLTDSLRDLYWRSRTGKRFLSLDQQFAIKEIRASFAVAYVKLCQKNPDELTISRQIFTDFIKSENCLLFVKPNKDFPQY